MTVRLGLFSPLPRPCGAEPNLAALGMDAGYSQCISSRRNKGAHPSIAGVLFSYPCVQGLNLEARVWGAWRRALPLTDKPSVGSLRGRGEAFSGQSPARDREAWSQVSEAPRLTARKMQVGEAGECPGGLQNEIRHPVAGKWDTAGPQRGSKQQQLG